MEHVVATEIELLDQGECGLRPLDLRYRHRAVQRHNWARCDRQQLVIQRQDLPPVGVRRGRCVAVHGVDRRLDLVWAGLVTAQASLDDGLPFGDQDRIPPAAVLIGQQHQRTLGGGASGPPRLDQQHQRQQTHDLGLIGHEPGQQPSQPDGLRAQVLPGQLLPRAGRVSLVEHEVDHGQHRAQPDRQVGLLRHPVRDAGVADLVLGAHQPLGHRRLGHQERPGDLGGGQPAQQTQRQGHLRGGGQRRVTAGEDQPQPVVAHGPLLGGLLTGVQQRGLGVPVRAGGLPAQSVDRPVAGRRDDPARRARW